MTAAHTGLAPHPIDEPTDETPLNLLIIEDEALVAMLVEDALTLHGHRVIGIADTVAAAMALVDAERPDMALCDVKLADGDSGVTAAQLLADRGIPCVFLSGNCPERAGHPLVIGCIAKPFRAGSLGAAVRAAHLTATGKRPNDPPPALTFYHEER
ncbi:MULTISPECIES: response regulator [Sphingomonas]|jgi:two-component system, response regulator PdtaR|uniref:Response regulator n=1 Tax=Sphingomonas zeae TaxID=1646122 RepID=A0A7Y6B3V3_9SPHN|nr:MULTISPECIES: response regulator [Sphingomonas]MBB4047554.1 DNA-binding response OmpR family regulator [Sphingomonas zeae]MDK8185087.1 response regulator [Sphingomonas zeae]MDK8214969.1 response regulator [Sphingomonas sp. UMB7805-LC452B]NUU46066.1 response regulator [Sphingomonas zeae]